MFFCIYEKFKKFIIFWITSHNVNAITNVMWSDWLIVSTTLPRKKETIDWNLNREDTFHELFISIVKLQLTSVKQIFTNGKSVKTIQQSKDLIGLRSNYRLKKLTDSIAHNTPCLKYRLGIHSEPIRTIPIHSDIRIRANTNHSKPIRKTFCNSFHEKR